jgi:hypothetical protein
MKRAWLAGLAVWTAAAPLGAQGYFAAPNGQTGAGLSFAPEQQGRAYAELAFIHSSQSQSLFGAEYDSYVTGVSWILGGGYKVRPNLELEVMLPMSWAETGFTASQGGIELSDSSAAFAVGNPHVGVNYLHADQRFRLKVGGALEIAPWNRDIGGEGRFALAAGALARSMQDPGLWAPEVLSIVTPARIEFGEKLVLGGDGALGLHVPTDGRDVELSIQLNPSFGYFASDTALVGLRLPFIWMPTQSGDSATQLALEPYARFDFDPAFINTRFTLNLDDPLGFSFDEGKVWAIHVGGGGAF